MREPAKWFHAAFDGGHAFAKLHLAHFTFDVGCDGLWANAVRVNSHSHVQRLPCNEVLQRRSPKMASKKAALGGSMTTGRHKDICGVLSKWREVVKDGVVPDSCTADLVDFLQR